MCYQRSYLEVSRTAGCGSRWTVRSSAGAGSGPTADPRPTLVIHPPGSPLLRFAAVVGWAGLVICIALLYAQWTAQKDYFNVDKGLQERFHSLHEKGRDKVAIIRVGGAIIEGDGYVKQQIDRVRQDDRVRAVVLRVDSPGGTVAAADYLYHHLRELKKEKQIPLVVSMGSLAASGGYYVSMAVGDQEKSIFAEPATWTGSIGVIIPHYDVSGLLERFDIKNDSISSHPRKQILSMTRPMGDEERKIVQGYVDEAFEQFKGVIQEGRPFFKKDREALDLLATGEIFTAKQAKENGLIDEIGFIEAAIDRAIELAKLDKKLVRVVEYKRPSSLIDGFVGLSQSGGQSLGPAAVLDMAAPRAYYLCTWLPVAMRSNGSAD